MRGETRIELEADGIAARIVKYDLCIQPLPAPSRRAAEALA